MTLFQCLLTNNDCYRANRQITPVGIMLHSTGADNPWLRRYLAPDDGTLGAPSSRHWNQPGLSVCVHAFIGRRADGTVVSYQTLPWTMRSWHCGRGSLGSGNDTHISIEICEDGLDDPVYFQAVYRESCQLIAWLCRRYHLDPLQKGVVLCHAEGHEQGIASNHGDVLHWFPRYGITMDHVRAEVAQILKEEEDSLTQEQFDAMMDHWLADRGALPPSQWAESILEEAVAQGITDGSRPQSLATRQEVAAMILASKKNPV